MDSGNDYTIIYLDISRYFENIWHEGLLSKCDSRGVATDFLVCGGGSNRRQSGQPTPKYHKNKKHRVLATSFSNLGGRPPRFSKKCGGQDPPTPRRRSPCVTVNSE